VDLSNAWSGRETAIHVHVGLRIKQAREAAGMTPREMAIRLGVSPARIVGYETGADRLTARQLFAIATVTGKSVSYFFEDLEPPGEAASAARAADAPARPVERVEETRALIAAFYEIKDSATRRDIIRLLRGIAEDMR
jgi:transcriptional regulator with XRE-family HTH domain